MKSNKKPALTGRGTLHLFLDALRSLLAPAIIGAVCLGGIMLFFQLEYYSAKKETVAKGSGFFIMSAEMSWLFSIAGAVICLVMGVLLFRFLASKQMVNVYAGFGISRRSFYLARLGAGALLVLLMYVVPMGMALAFNLKYYGAMGIMLRAWGFLFAGYLLQGLFVLAAAAAVMVMVGTLAEGFVFSAFVLNLPLVFQFCVYSLARSLLWGNALGIRDNQVLVWYSGGGLVSPLLDFQAFSPLLFMEQFVSACGEGTWDAGRKVMLGGLSEGYCRVPGITALLGWLAALAVVALVGVWLFQMRKMERAGFLGKSKVLNTVFILCACLAAFSAASSLLLRVLPFWAAVLLGTAALGLVFCTLEAALLRNKLLFRKSLYQLPLCMLVAVGCAVAMQTGGLGYETKIPKLQDIESATVSLPVKSDYLGTACLNRTGSSDGSSWANSDMQTESGLIGLSSERDLRLVQSLHQAAIGLKRECSHGKADVYIAFDVIYKKKNGSMVKRHYENLPYDFWEKALELCVSDRAKESILKGFTQTYQDRQIAHGTAEELEQQFLETVSYGTDRFTLMAGTGAQHRVNLEEKKFTELKRCVAEDLVGQTVKQRWFPAEEPAGYLLFHPPLSEWEPVEPIRLWGRICQVPVTADMKRTLRFLQENGLTQYFQPEEKPVSAWVVSAQEYWKRNLVPFQKTNKDMLYQFIGKQYDLNSYHPATQYKLEGAVASVLDSGALADLEAASRSIYFDTRDGYYVLFGYGDGSGRSAYLPAASIPPSLKEALKHTA